MKAACLHLAGQPTRRSCLARVTATTAHAQSFEALQVAAVSLRNVAAKLVRLRHARDEHQGRPPQGEAPPPLYDDRKRMGATEHRAGLLLLVVAVRDVDMRNLGAAIIRCASDRAPASALIPSYRFNPARRAETCRA